MIVADASVLIGLSAIGQLELLRERFPDGVLIPPAVWREVVEQGGERPGAQTVAEADWITVEEVVTDEIVQLLQEELDDGETEAIALAHQVGADAVLLDERDARRAARSLNVPVLGTIGVLVWARRTGRIVSLRSVLEALQVDSKFRISRQLYLQALAEVGELRE